MREWEKPSLFLMGVGFEGSNTLSLSFYLFWCSTGMVPALIQSPWNSQERRKLKPKSGVNCWGTLIQSSLDLNLELVDSKATSCPLHPTSSFTSSLRLSLALPCADAVSRTQLQHHTQAMCWGRWWICLQRLGFSVSRPCLLHLISLQTSAWASSQYGNFLLKP